MKPKAIPLWWCSLALLIGGCPKRQAPPRIVYVPSPQHAAMQAPGPENPLAMVIQEPAPPEPAVIIPPPETSTPKEEETAPQHHHVQRREQTPPAPESAPETDEDSSPVPSLAPQGSSSEQATQRHEIQGLQDDVQKRIAKLGAADLSAVDRKTLEDAKAFIAQSTQALNEADLQRALMLARKASLLVSALEK